jgi:hypothetical protein
MLMTDERYHLLTLTGDCSVKSAQAVAAQLREALPGRKRIAVATRDVTGADLTTVQLLLAARASAEANGCTLAMAAPLAAPLRDFLQASGLSGPGGTDFWTSTIPAEETA